MTIDNPDADKVIPAFSAHDVSGEEITAILVDEPEQYHTDETEAPGDLPEPAVAATPDPPAEEPIEEVTFEKLKTAISGLNAKIKRMTETRDALKKQAYQMIEDL